MAIRQCPHFYGTIIEPDCYQMASAGILSHSQTETCLGDYENCALYQRAKAETAERQESALLHMFGGPEFATSFSPERLQKVSLVQPSSMGNNQSLQLTERRVPDALMSFPPARHPLDILMGTIRRI